MLSNITTDERGEEFLEKRKLNKDYIEVINVFLELFNINDSGTLDFIRSDYIEKYNLLKERENKPITNILEEKEDPVDHCLVCFDDFDKETMFSKDHNAQCLVCKNIFHKECLNKWFLYNKTCPYCRSPSSQNTNYVDSNEDYLSLF